MNQINKEESKEQEVQYNNFLRWKNQIEKIKWVEAKAAEVSSKQKVTKFKQ